MPTSPDENSASTLIYLILESLTSLTSPVALSKRKIVSSHEKDLLHEQKTHRLVLWDECDSF